MKFKTERINFTVFIKTTLSYFFLLNRKKMEKLFVLFLVVMAGLVARADEDSSEEIELDSEEIKQLGIAIEAICAVVTSPEFLDTAVPCLRSYDGHPVMKALDECLPSGTTTKDLIKTICNDPESLAPVGECLSNKNVADVAEKTEDDMDENFLECILKGFGQ